MCDVAILANVATDHVALLEVAFSSFVVRMARTTLIALTIALCLLSLYYLKMKFTEYIRYTVVL